MSSAWSQSLNVQGGQLTAYRKSVKIHIEYNVRRIILNLWFMDIFVHHFTFERQRWHPVHVLIFAKEHLLQQVIKIKSLTTAGAQSVVIGCDRCVNFAKHKKKIAVKLCRSMCNFVYFLFILFSFMIHNKSWARNKLIYCESKEKLGGHRRSSISLFYCKRIFDRKNPNNKLCVWQKWWKF